MQLSAGVGYDWNTNQGHDLLNPLLGEIEVMVTVGVVMSSTCWHQTP
jgi:hypothetical protein